MSLCIVFANIDHITFVLSMSFFIFFMAFIFDTACRVFQIGLRNGGGPPVGGMENFAGFFFLLGVGNLKRSEFDHFYFF